MFKTTNDDRNYGDLTRFVVDFLSFIREACEQVLAFLGEKNELIRHYEVIIHNMPLEDHTKQLLYILCQVSICESDSLSMKEMADINGISSYPLKKRLSLIEPYLMMSHSGTSKVYRADLQKLDSIQ
jgi:hypothetical protein